jgi:hypothetical protein
LDVLEKGKIFPLAGFGLQIKILHFRNNLRKKGRKNSVCAFLQLEEFGEILHDIYIALSIADEGGPDTECSSKVA